MWERGDIEERRAMEGEGWRNGGGRDGERREGGGAWRRYHN